MRRLYITTATGALLSEQAPAGGGVAVLEALIPRLKATGVPIPQYYLEMTLIYK